MAKLRLTPRLGEVLCWLCLLALPCLVLAENCLAQGGSLELAGIKLLEPAASFKDRLELGQLEEELRIPYVVLAAIKPSPGVRGGYATLGNCLETGRILRIKLDYQESSLAFYELVLKELKKRYGEPKQWRGNPFGTLRAWKWSIKDPSGRSLSLILQHYSGDDGAYTKGNSLRLSSPLSIEAEKQCSEQYQPENAQKSKLEVKLPVDLNTLLPR